MSKKEVCIVIGATKNYTSQLAAVILGIKRHCCNFYDSIIVYHNGINDDIQNEFKNISESIEFKPYGLEMLEGNVPPLIDEYSIVTFSRFECFNMLNFYKTVIWLDIDILIQNDISSLLSYGKESGMALSISDCGFLNYHNFTENIKNYNMYTNLYNAGMIVLTDTLVNFENMTEWCYKKLYQLGKKLLWCDQGILNILIQEYNIEVEEINIEKYVCHPERKSVKESTIVHSYGREKFWNSMSRDIAFPEWSSLVQEWAVQIYNIHKKPRVSVIMSIYNRIDFIDTAINSILSQTMINFELIIVVEFSSIQQEICKYLTKFDDKRIVIIKNKTHLGFAESLNEGLKIARGEYIARCDDDDYSVLERFQVQSDYLDEHKDIDIVGSYIKCFGDSFDIWDRISLFDDEIRIRMLFETQIYHPTAMMRASRLREYNLKYNKQYFTEDYFFWAQAVKYCKFANIPKVLVRYRSSNLNITSNNENKINMSHINVMRWQFKNYLGLDLSYDELVLLSRRKNIIDNIDDKKTALMIRKNAVKKIISANKSKKFYNHNILIQFIDYKDNRFLEVTHNNHHFGIIDYIILYIFNYSIAKMKKIGIIDKLKKFLYNNSKS